MDQEIRLKPEGAAALLSLVVPGFGQIYNGDYLRGALWLLLTPGFWIGSGGLLGWVCHFVSAYTAFHRNREKRRYLPPRRTPQLSAW